MTVTYSYRCTYTGNTYRCRAHNVASVRDETYPPGGTLRVMRTATGGLVAGPLVSEILTFKFSE